MLDIGYLRRALEWKIEGKSCWAKGKSKRPKQYNKVRQVDTKHKFQSIRVNYWLTTLELWQELLWRIWHFYLGNQVVTRMLDISTKHKSKMVNWWWNISNSRFYKQMPPDNGLDNKVHWQSMPNNQEVSPSQ